MSTRYIQFDDPIDELSRQCLVPRTISGGENPILSKEAWEYIRDRSDLFYETTSGAWIAEQNTMLCLLNESGVGNGGISPVTLQSAQAKEGFVYILKSSDNLYKIGCSVDPTKRIETLGVLLPFPIEPIHQFPATNYLLAEYRLHKDFAHHKVRGEWFRLLPEQVDFLKSIRCYDSGGFFFNNEE